MFNGFPCLEYFSNSMTFQDLQEPLKPYCSRVFVLRVMSNDQSFYRSYDRKNENHWSLLIIRYSPPVAMYV